MAKEYFGITEADLAKSVLIEASALNWFLVSSVAISIAVLSLKMIYPNPEDRKLRLPVVNIDVRASYIYPIFIFLSLLHVFFAGRFLRGIAEVILCDNRSLAILIHKDLFIVTSSVTFSGMLEREVVKWLGIPMTWTSSSFGDFAFIGQLFFAIVCFLALARWRGLRFLGRLTFALIAFSLVFANWWIGTQWTLAASDVYELTIQNGAKKLQDRDPHKWMIKNSHVLCRLGRK